MKLFLIVLFILNTLHLTAQEKMICFSVLSNDLSASTECRLDDKGKACALIKIQAMDKIEKVEVNETETSSSNNSSSEANTEEKEKSTPVNDVIISIVG